MHKKILSLFALTVLIFSVIPAAAFAHVVVTPARAGIGQELTFNVSVPNEKEVAVTQLKLTIPGGVTNVIPTSIYGWTITATKNGDNITQIMWSDGTIPVGQRQDFSFSAQVPGNATELHWKAYQTYADGTVVHWDQTPAGSDDATGNAGPFSVTKVANDLTTSSSAPQSSSVLLAIALSLVAIILSIGALLIRKRKN